MDPRQVNVLDLPKRPGFVEPPIEHLATRHLPIAPTISDVEENEIDSLGNSRNSTRRKRQAGVVILPEAITDNEGKTRHIVTLVRKRTWSI